MRNSKFKVIAVWTTVIVITVLFVVLLITRINANKEFKSYKDIENSNLVITDILGQEETKYYVFVYSSKGNYDNAKQKDLEPAITKYFTYVHLNKKNENIVPIYAYDVDAFKTSSNYASCSEYLTELSSNISISNCPVLLLVEGKTISSVYKTFGGSNGIESTLSLAMTHNDK